MNQDAFIKALVTTWTDPYNPANKLKRPAWRTCLNCGQKFKSELQILASSLYCSVECGDAYEAKAEAILGHSL